MKPLLFLAVLLLAPCAVVPVYKVVKVVDGDTVVVSRDDLETTIRVLGIDCPESRPNSKCRRDDAEGRPGCAEQIPKGKAATKRARELLDGATVSLECAGKCTSDRYRRALRYIRLADGHDYGLVMVREKLCEDYSWKYPHPRGEEYRDE